MEASIVQLCTIGFYPNLLEKKKKKDAHMGNSCPLPCDRYMYVGKNVSVLYRKEERYLEEGKLETSIVSYHVGYSVSALLILETTYGKNGLIKLLRFKVQDPESDVTFDIDRAENNLLNQINTNDFRKFEINFVNETKNRLEGVTKTNVAYHGTIDEGSLLVVEQKRKSGVQKPYVAVVAHYYAICSRSIFLWKYDVALSMLVNVRVLNNDLDVFSTGCNSNTSISFLAMFDQVSQTRTWHWKTCPYYVAETERRECSGVTGKQFKTETETETETESDDEEGTYHQRRKQIGGSILANPGVIKGNNNGNLVVNKLFLGGGN